MFTPTNQMKSHLNFLNTKNRESSILKQYILKNMLFKIYIYIYIFWKIKTTSPNKNKTKERPFQSYSLLRGGGHHRWHIWNLARKKKQWSMSSSLFSSFLKNKMFVLIMVQTKTRIIATSKSLLDLYYVSEKIWCSTHLLEGFT